MRTITSASNGPTIMPKNRPVRRIIFINIPGPKKHPSRYHHHPQLQYRRIYHDDNYPQPETLVVVRYLRTRVVVVVVVVIVVGAVLLR